VRRARKEQIPLHRLGRPEDIADVVLLMLSDEARRSSPASQSWSTVVSTCGNGETMERRPRSAATRPRC